MLVEQRGGQKQQHKTNSEQRIFLLPFGLKCRLKFTMKQKSLSYGGVVFRIMHSIIKTLLCFDE